MTIYQSSCTRFRGNRTLFNRINFSSACVSVACLTLLLAAPALEAKDKKVVQAIPLTPEQAQIIDKAASREKVVIETIKKRTPLVETYLQNMKPDPVLRAVPASDYYSLARIDFGKVIGDKSYNSSGQKKGFFRGSLSAVTGLGKALKLDFNSAGFTQEILPDSNGIDRQRYTFSYVRREFLGSVRTSVFDVTPNKGTGYFVGRIWVEDQEGNIVRFNGSYSGGGNGKTYLHFDSWRTNIQPGLWLPYAVYTEESSNNKSLDHPLNFKAQTRIWGYSLKIPTGTSDNVSISIEGADNKSDSAQDVSPLQAQRAWVQQAENNVLDRLFQAGLLAAPSDFDKILETVTNNIIVTNNLPLNDTIRCRIMLTSNLESLSVGNTIILSKGLVDTLSTEEDLAAALSFQLAHIVLGHRLDTRYAFNDALLFPDTSVIKNIPMHHSDADNDAAAKKAVELLGASPYKDKLGNAGLYLSTLQTRGKALENLTAPRLGDSLFRPGKNETLWLQDLAAKAPKIEMNNLSQVPALPLGSRLKVDAWDDRVLQLSVKPVALLNASDKMPFEVTPLSFRLDRYAEPVASPAAAPAPAQTGVQSAPSGAVTVPDNAATPAPPPPTTPNPQN